jgi:hypothetical protein
MRTERRSMPEQELSIKEREQELYDEPRELPPAKPPVRPFPIYLRETPAVPMSAGVKTTLWIVGIVVVLLLIAALWRTQRSPRIHRASAAPRASAMIAPHFFRFRPDGSTASFQVPNSGRLDASWA